MKNRKASDLEDDADKQAIAAYRKGKLVPVANQAAMKTMLRKAATDYRKKKQARINIRLPEVDLAELKEKAAEEGMPYQTLIASVLHKFVNGRLVSA